MCWTAQAKADELHFPSWVNILNLTHCDVNDYTQIHFFINSLVVA